MNLATMSLANVISLMSSVVLVIVELVLWILVWRSSGERRKRLLRIAITGLAFLVVFGSFREVVTLFFR